MNLPKPGQQFSCLTAIKPDPDNTKPHLKWFYRCECGKEKSIRVSDVTNNNTKSCGCIAAEVTRKRNMTDMRKHHPSIGTAKYIYAANYDNGDITFDEFMQLSQLNCFYCEAKPFNKARRFGKHASDYHKDNCTFIYNGLDRINPTVKEHNKNNCIPACIDCNQAKSDQTLLEFWNRVENIVKNTLIGRNFNLNIPSSKELISILIDKGFLKLNKNGTYNAVGIFSRFKSCVCHRYKDTDLPPEILYYLTTSPCFYCGCAPLSEIRYNGQILRTNGLDRVINNDITTGERTIHRLENVVPCCYYCNFAKNNHTYEEFIAWAERVFANKDKIITMIAKLGLDD